MKLLLRVRPNPLLWLLVFVTIALTAEKFDHEAHTALHSFGAGDFAVSCFLNLYPDEKARSGATDLGVRRDVGIVLLSASEVAVLLIRSVVCRLAYSDAAQPITT